MFTNTFTESVQRQFQKRATYSAYNHGISTKSWSLVVDQDGEKSYVDWITRTPFVLAYSNVRYTDSTTQENHKHSIVGSMQFVSNSYIMKRQFNDYYDMNDDFGVLSQPVITELIVDGRGKSGTLKDIFLKIQCFNYEQFFNVRKYFAVPCTSIFLQFGNYVNEEQIKSSLYPPIITNGGNFGDAARTKFAGSYVSNKTLESRYGDLCNIQALCGVVYGFEINQQEGLQFELQVKMMTKGTSQILNFIRPAVASQTSSKKDGNKEEGFNKSLSKALIDWSRKQEFATNRECIYPMGTSGSNKDASRFVSYNWLINMPIFYLRTETYTQLSKISWAPPLDEQLFIFKPQFGFKAQFISSTPDVFIKTPIYSSVKTTARDFLMTDFTEIYELQKSYYSLRQMVNKNLTWDTLTEQKYMEKFQELYGTYKHIHEGQTDKQFGWWGNVYIRLQAVKQIIEKTEKLTIDNVISGINNLIMQAIGGGLSISSNFNSRKQYFEIQQNTLHYGLGREIYSIPNFGHNSVVKNVSYNMKMPDGYKVSIFSAYGTNKGMMNDLFNAMFGGQSAPSDIMLYYGVPEDVEVVGGDQQNKPQSQKTNEDSVQEFKKEYDGKYNTLATFKELSKQGVRQKILKYNLAHASIEKQNIKVKNGVRGLSSIYSIQVELTVDFISNIDWGDVFKLRFNPVGWETRFYVSNVKHQITPDHAETQIKGMMFG